MPDLHASTLMMTSMLTSDGSKTGWVYVKLDFYIIIMFFTLIFGDNFFIISNSAACALHSKQSINKLSPICQ